MSPSTQSGAAAAELTYGRLYEYTHNINVHLMVRMERTEAATHLSLRVSRNCITADTVA